MMGGCCSSSKHSSPTKEVNLSAKKEEKQNLEQAKGNEKEEAASKDKVLAIINDIPLLSSLKDSDKLKIKKHLKERKFANGENLMVQGEKGSDFFIIAKGLCSVIVKNDDGKETEIAKLSDGDYCGEQALLSDATRSATIRSVSDHTLCFTLDQKSFQQITQENNIHFAKRSAKRNAVSAEDFKDKADEKEAKAEDGKERASAETSKWLLECVGDNVLFSHLDREQRAMVVSNMYRHEMCKKDNALLITQGEEGNIFYVVESGSFEITVKNVGVVKTLDKGMCVGELALLYNSPRAASVELKSSSAVLWAVDRGAFRTALKKVGQKSSSENIEFLKQCNLLKPLIHAELVLVDEALEKREFAPSSIIFTEGDDGDRFYILKCGHVKGEAKNGTQFELSPGSFFGERALLTNDTRAATIKAVDRVTCLTLSRGDFTMLLGPLDDIMKRNIEEYKKPEQARQPIFGKKEGGSKDEEEAKVCDLSELKVIGILGRGAFGTVKLVVDESTSKSYALKGVCKNQVVELGQQTHILSEKRVMAMMSNRFLVNLIQTYKDEYRLYFLLEVCLGGELFTVLRKMRSFDENTSKFYAACVIEGFGYMHERDIIYRDLKPENLVITDTGYIKITDFGFAKVVKGKTFTLCGTPDYLAPEIVTGQGHGKGVDWWTLGILIYEMLASFPPFFDDEPMMTYRKIIQGKFKFPRYLSTEAKDLISKLLKSKSTKRLGVIKGGTELIKQHPWFAKFSWEKLQTGEMKVPIKPNVKSVDDLSNFDDYEEENEDVKYKGDADLGWDEEF